MSSPTVEDYAKRIYALEQESGGATVPTGAIADALSVVPGTVTAMLKRLSRGGLVRYESYCGARLTAKGRRLALDVLRRHRLIETWLVESLGLDWADVHEEAEQLEHAMSSKLLDRIDEVLGRPRVDPHGDPIPDAQGGVRRSGLTPLTECGPGRTGRIARVLDQNGDFLRFLDKHGLRPGRSFTVLENDPSADAVVIRPRGARPITVGARAAAKLLVETGRGTSRRQAKRAG